MARLPVRLTPSAGRDAIEAYRDGVLHVRVKAPPENGKANAALLRLLARTLGDPGARIVTGATSRRKLVDLPSLTEAELTARLPHGA